MKKNIYSMLLVLILCGIDQFSKWWAVSYLKNAESTIIIEDVLHFTYVENRGAAFGSFMGMGIMLATITIIALGILIWKLNQIPSTKRYLCMNTSIIVFISGAIGNLIDRLLRGYVVDFIYFVPIDFPKFNFADSFIVVSLIVLMIALLFYYDDEEFESLISIKSGWKNRK